MPTIRLDLLTLTEDKILRWLRDTENSTPEIEYRENALEDYRFYAGKQDTTDGLARLREQRRPATVYNEVKPKIDMLIGLAAQSKHDPRAIPVGVEDNALAELVTGALKHYRRKLNLGRKELECFEHCVKSGRSLLYFYVDQSNPFQPEVKCKRFNGRNFYVDSQSVEYDLSDARFVFLETWLDSDTLVSRWPEFDIHGYQNYARTHDMPTFFNEARDLYRVVECWYTKFDDIVWFQNPLNGQIESLYPKEFRQFATMLQQGLPVGPNGEVQKFEVPQTQQSKKKTWYYRILSGDMVIEEGRSSYKWDGFPGVLYGAYKDEDTNCWFGAIKMMKDPQRAINAMKRQLSHLLQTLPKGILVHEAGAILNIEEYEKNSADPGFHLELAANGIGRYKFETQPQISPIYSNFSAECSQSMKDASGIQNEMMGQETSSRTPGVTVRNRQETGLAVLYTLYDNFKESRILGDKILLKMLQQFTAPGELVRIVGPEGAQLVQINTQSQPGQPGFNDLRILEYDIDIAEVNETQTSRQMFADILADYSRNNPGSIPADLLLEYSDAPFSAIQKIKAYSAQQAMSAQQAADREYELKLLEIQVKAAGQDANNLIKARETEIKGRQLEQSKAEKESQSGETQSE